MAFQNDVEHLMHLMEQEKLTADQANVALVRIKRFWLVIGSLPAKVRKALNAAVKTGELGHMKKEGHKPECYFHPIFDYMAKDARSRHENTIKRTLANVLA